MLAKRIFPPADLPKNGGQCNQYRRDRYMYPDIIAIHY